MPKIFSAKKTVKKAFKLNIRQTIWWPLVSLFLVLFFLPGLAMAAPVLSLSPLGGPAGTELTVSGNGFEANSSGYVWFDTNGNGTREDNEPKVDVNTNGSGGFNATLTVPNVAPANYLIRANVPQGEPIEAEAFFKLTAPVLTLGTTSGPPGIEVIITGYYFAPGKSGWVWFDTDNDYVRDEGEPAMRVNTNSVGRLRASLIVPHVASGAYPIRADLPEGGYVDAWTTFTAAPVINLNPSSGSPGTLITVTGRGFTPGGEILVWFDTNKNGNKDNGEPSTTVPSDSSGKIIAALTVPATGLSPEDYPVQAGLSATGALAKTNFTVKGATLSLSPNKGIPGTTVIVTGHRFPANTPGWVWFDTNGNYERDSGEFYKKVTANGYGKFIVSLTIPSVAAGVYYIRAELSPVMASGSINILPAPSLSLSLTTGPPETIITVNGKNFKPWTNGKIWFDTNGNEKKDVKDPAKSLKTDGFGKFRAALTVPKGISPGAYAIYADVPAWGVPEAWTDFFATRGDAGNGLSAGILQAVSVIPPDGAEKVQRYPTLKIVFASRLVKGPEFGNIVLSDEDGNPVITKASLSGKTLKVRPGQILKGEKTYVLLIPTEAVLSQTNNGLEEEFILTFTTKK